MPRSLRRLSVAGVLAAGLPLGLLATSASAATARPATGAVAAVACQFSSCTGKDPADEGCGSDAITLDSRTDAAGDEVELRYSSACGAAWSRVTIPWGSDPYFQAIANGWPCDVNAGQSCAETTEKSAYTDAYTQLWSPMINFSDFVQACSSPLLNGQVLCTGAH